MIPKFKHLTNEEIQQITFDWRYKGWTVLELLTETEVDEINEELPITKRKYWNTANEDGGYVSYGRAKQLGII